MGGTQFAAQKPSFDRLASITDELTWQQAEAYACVWMQANGYVDARLSPPGADGGIDITSRAAIARVKHHAEAVSLTEMQRLFGIAQSAGKVALFFSAAGYSPKAIVWARARQLQIYSYPPVRRVN